eukprot:SAG11_NODE_1002_length_6214_cov_2.976124_8_plen_63_part_00
MGEGGYAVYTIRYDDGSVERGVRPELVQPTDGVLPCADDIVGIGVSACGASSARSARATTEH